MNYRQIYLLLLIPLICFFFSKIIYAEDCLLYEPTIVTLKGQLEKQTFPGPPNYENIKTGDKLETYLILILDKEICLKGNPSDDINVSEYNIKTIQLAISQEQYKQYEDYFLKEVVVTGSLFHSHTSHHHTQVLMKVLKINFT